MQIYYRSHLEILKCYFLPVKEGNASAVQKYTLLERFTTVWHVKLSDTEIA